MTELIAAPVEGSDAAEESIEIDECVCQPPVLITVQAVTFSTAAGAPRPRLFGRAMAGLRTMFVSTAEDSPPVPRHYPPRREAFMEQAAMMREMRRL